MRAKPKVSTRRNPTVDAPTVKQTLTNAQRNPTVTRSNPAVTRSNPAVVTPTVNQTSTKVKQALSAIRNHSLLPAPNSSFATYPVKDNHITGGHIEAAKYRSRFDTSDADADSNIRYYYSTKTRTLASSE